MAAMIDNGDTFFKHFEEDGITMLKFGRRGHPQERCFKLLDKRFLVWRSRTLSPKLGCLSEVDLWTTIRNDALRKGHTTWPFDRHKKNYGEPQVVKKSMSIMYIKDGVKRSLDLVCANSQVFKKVYKSLELAISNLNIMRKTLSVERLYFKAKFEEADKDRTNDLSKSEILSMVPSMNINMSKQEIKYTFAEHDKDNNGTLNFPEFCMFLEVLRRRVDLEAIWCEAVSGKPWNITVLDLPQADSPAPPALKETMKEDDFLRFWNSTQRERMDPLEMKKKIIAAKKGMQCTDDDVSDSSSSELVNYNIFRNIMTSTANEAYEQSKVDVEEDMNLALSDYFIATSHNTYLEGDQLFGKSSVSRYIHDLSVGCRCVELDCWDGDNGEPGITHGHTATGKIRFLDVIEAIKMSAFANSPYPVILSLENHCHLKQQGVMAFMLKEVFGDDILRPPDRLGFALPSPQDNKYKFIIKGKTCQPEEKEEEEEEEDETEVEDLDYFGVDDRKRPSKESTAKKKNQKAKEKKKSEGEDRIHPELSDITFLDASKFDLNDSKRTPNCIRSFSEKEMGKMLKEKETLKDWTKHNTKFLSRVYPSPRRIDSSNYDPTQAWLGGAQCVALNYQRGDINMQLNIGKFRANRGQGYVTKPMRMLSKEGQETLTKAHNKKKHKVWIDYFWGPACANNYPVKLTIHVISGQALPKPRGSTRGEVIDPYVEVIINGEPEDRVQRKTKTIDNNGFNPVWNEIFEIEVRRPDIAMLTLRCMDEDTANFHDFIASSSIPVCMLRQGFRTVQMYDEHGMAEGHFTFAALFIYVCIETAKK